MGMESFSTKNNSTEDSVGEFEKTESSRDFREDFSKFAELQPAITNSELRSYSETYPELEPLVNDFFKYTERYAKDVWEMNFKLKNGTYLSEGSEQLAEDDDRKTILHTALTDSVAILARALGKRDVDRSWVMKLTDGEGKLSRAACGNLAIVLEYRRYIENLA